MVRLKWKVILNSFYEVLTIEHERLEQSVKTKIAKTINSGSVSQTKSYSSDRMLKPMRGLRMSGPAGYQPFRLESKLVHDFSVQDVTSEMYLQPRWRHSWQTGGPSWSPRYWGSPWTGWWTGTRPRPFCQQRRRRHLLLSDFREEITIFVLFTLIDIVLMLWHFVLTLIELV